MITQKTITQRVKFLIKHIIGQGLAENQEDLGKRIGIKNKSQMSQLVSNYIPNENFINKLLDLAPQFNKLWLYNEAIENPFLTDTTIDIGSASTDTVLPEAKIQQLEGALELLKKDVKYYADIADSRLATIGVQNTLIEKMEKLIDMLEKQKY